ncbi:DUF3144 domain-containing protein [Pseudoduganella albidiflava]|uniref:DUF3144 domain-containing protein n=1 Tax=Pseudoduganella albidiflava TaxID=321983 RepID=A0A411X1Q6_9BURK|nr:DUF3144 domain-containing protein [Pseudoduganella albidiflava]QBI02868.1 DUF3144 domain-containing protein [Pseudoduganella albidiflava]GGY56988.1 hypothetical protein GCM10007387_44430 [Pseudoduganella albidiflava]
MSDNGIDAAFWERADAIIHLANEQGTKVPNSNVSASLLYAAARFNAFIVATGATSAEAMEKDKEEAIRYFTDEYRKMLSQNLDDHIANFNTYMPRTPQQ